MKNFILICGICLAAVFFPDRAGSQILNVPLVIQEQNEWCWDATSCCVLGYYGVDVDQCVVAEFTRTHAVWHNFGSVNCCDDPGQGCNYPNQMWGDPGSAQAVMQEWGVQNYGYYPNLSPEQIQSELAAAHPFIMLWSWTTGGGHALVGHGLIGSSLYYMDPWPGDGYTIADYSWVVSSSDHTWSGVNVITSPFIDNPLPPTGLSAYSDYRTPTAVTLRWSDPTAMRSGLEIPAFTIDIFRDTTLIGQVGGGIMSFTDTGLVTHALCRYRVRAEVSGIRGSAVLDSCFAGGSAIPQAPTSFWARDGADGSHLWWVNPSRQIDGTPLNDMGQILIYRDGILVDSAAQSSADSGQVRFHVDPAAGYHAYYLRTRDTESPAHASDATAQVIAFGGLATSDVEDFENGTANLYRIGSWDTTQALALSGRASLTDSPYGNSLPGTISDVWFPPCILSDESFLQLYQIAIVDPATSLARIDISTDNRHSFKTLGIYNWNSFPEWADSVANPGDWRKTLFDLRKYLFDTVTVRLRLVTTTHNMGDGWYIDSVSVLPSNLIVTDSIRTVSGWNLLSLPVKPSATRCADLYPCASSPAFAYTGAYEPIDSVCAGLGFWLKFDTASVIPMTGRDVTSDSIAVAAGWNIIGALTESVPLSSVTVHPPDLLESQFFAYDGGYSIASSLDPGKGYWVRTKQSGAIVLRAGSAVPEAAGIRKTDTPAGENLLFLSDVAGHSQTLTFGAGNGTSRARVPDVLPPLPPGGMFDIRFATGRSRSVVPPDSRTVCLIALTGVRYPLEVRWQIHSGQATGWALQFDSTTLGMKGNGTATIPASPGTLELVYTPGGLQEIPVAFSLAQNYPNPFNPSTAVGYGLPVDCRVKLEVYNVIGGLVARLRDGVERAGYRRAVWNASSLPSGIYFYRLEATGVADAKTAFVEVKKMLLLR